jgi:hypothetical protein
MDLNVGLVSPDTTQNYGEGKVFNMKAEIIHEETPCAILSGSCIIKLLDVGIIGQYLQFEQ